MNVCTCGLPDSPNDLPPRDPYCPIHGATSPGPKAPGTKPEGAESSNPRQASSGSGEERTAQVDWEHEYRKVAVQLGAEREAREKLGEALREIRATTWGEGDPVEVATRVCQIAGAVLAEIDGREIMDGNENAPAARQRPGAGTRKRGSDAERS